MANPLLKTLSEYKKSTINYIIKDIYDRKLDQVMTLLAIKGVIRLARHYPVIGTHLNWFSSYDTKEGSEFWNTIKEAPYR